MAFRLSVALLAHSQRQLRRARGHPRTWPAAPDVAVPAPALAPPPAAAAAPLLARALPSGWAPPLPAAATAALPFHVARTTLGRQVPVYSEYKNGRSRRLTLVRRVSGDAEALVEELRRVTGGASVVARPGRIEIEGDRCREVKNWLMSLGL
jgi:large subunit ribosomal protein L49